MNEIKWITPLSTTTPNNDIGLIKIRQSNINSEIWYVPITQNGLPLNFTSEGITQVFFCTKFGKSPVEQRATIIDAKKGHISYTMNDKDTQKTGLRLAYFKFEDDKGNFRGATQTFAYHVIPSIEASCSDGGTYIVRLEELFELYQEYMNNQMSDWESFFEAYREIIESIDPGGILLYEMIAARDKEKDLNTRLERDKRNLQEQIDFIKNEHYLMKTGETNKTRTLIDNDFSKNHAVIKTGEVDVSLKVNPIIIATVDDEKQNRFKLRKVGVL